MSGEDGTTTTRRFRWLVWLPVGLVLYVLSIGPVAWALMTWGDHLPRGVEGALGTFYAPLAYLARHCRPAEGFFRWYAGLFGIH